MSHSPSEMFPDHLEQDLLQIDERLAYVERLMEQMEDRVLFDAVPDGGAALDPQAAEPPPEATARPAQSEIEREEQFESRSEIIVIDAAVTDADTLLADILEKRANESLEVRLLDPDQDGVKQIADMLDGRAGISAIHIVSHGSAAQLQLGTATLDNNSMTGHHADELARISDALSDEADLMIYGCDFGAGERGQQAAMSLARLTGADVAASTDDTGHADLGGDWLLELSTGKLQTEIIVSGALQSAWSVLLATPANEFYVPITEQGVYDANEKILDEGSFGAVDTTVRTTIGITANSDGTVIYFDHHEDGFEADLSNPAQSTTQIWGDGNAANGIAPGFATDFINAGDIIILQNDIDTATPPAFSYDGGDRLASDTGIAVTRGAWNVPWPGTVLAGTTEVANVSKWGTQYVSPLGEDTALDTLYEYTGLFVMASTDGTTVDIDADADGIAELSLTLNQGETYHVDGGVLQGATVSASAAVQVNLITGDRDSGVDSRWYMLKPRDSWTDSYISPAGTTQTGDPASVIVFNPHATDLDVEIETLAGTVNRTVAAGDTLSERFDQAADVGSAIKVSSTDGRDFYASLAMDSDNSSHTAYDWGYSLLPEGSLSEMVLAGWAPGSSDLTGNGSPVWITSDSDTTIYIDFDGNPNTGALTDPFGNRYDQQVAISRLESYRIYDGSDNDQTGVRVYTIDGSNIAAAWGIDPSTAGGGSPFLDMGTVVLPFPVALITKTATLTTDVNGNQVADPGDILTWTVTVTNQDATPLGSPIVIDTVPADTTYVANTTYINGVLEPDDLSGTTIPIDNDGINFSPTLPDLNPGETHTVSFQTTLDAFGAIPYTSVTNTAIVQSDQGTRGRIHTYTDINTQAPQIDLDTNDSTAAGADYLTTYTEGGGAIPLFDSADNDAAILDPDGTHLTALTITLTNPQTGDSLAIAGSLPSGILITSQTSSQIVLGGAATLSNYQAALESIRFSNSSPHPSLTDRSITFVANDGGFDSNVATATVQFQRLNDPPSFVGLDNTPTYTEGTSPAVLDPDATISDPELDDIDNYAGATLMLQRSGGANGNDVFGATGSLSPLAQGGNLIVGGTTIGTVSTNNGGTLLLTFNNNATAALVDSTLQQIAYSNTNITPPGSVTIDFIINDGNAGAQGSGGPLQGSGSVTVTIIPVNDAPTAVDDSSATDENTIVNVGAGTGLLNNDFDINGDTLTVVSHDGTSALGASVTVNADGSYTYDPTNSPALNSLAPGETAVDTFTYTIADPDGLQSTALVTITVTAIDDNLTATDDVAATDEDTVLSEPAPGILLNDSDPDNSLFSLTTLNYDASRDGLDDGNWPDSNSVAGFDWSLDASVTRQGAPTTTLPGVRAAYSFNGTAGGTMSSLQNLAGNPSNDSASFELWFKPSDASGDEVLFESGATGDGVAFTLNGGNIEFKVKDSAANAQLSSDISTEIGSGDFIQVVGTVDTSTGTVTLFVNGQQVDAGTQPGIGDWSGGNGAGLGQVNGGINFGSPSPFEGEIAIFRFYETALNGTQAQTAYDSIASPHSGLTITQVNGVAYIPGTLVTLPRGAELTLFADGSYDYDPTTSANWQALNAGDSAIDSFSYQVQDGIGNASSANVNITIQGRNDQITATNLVQTQTYLEDTPSVAIDDIVVTEIDAGDIITAVLTLDDTSAGSLTANEGATYSSITGVWTIAGTATAVNTALANVAFLPALNYDVDTFIDIAIQDGNEDGTATLTGRIDVDAIPQNDPPVVDLDNNDSTTAGADYLTTFTEGDSPIAIGDVDISVTDVDDSAIEGATITLTNTQVGDALSALDTDLSWPAGITASINGTNDVITLAGTASLADYETAIGLLRFVNSGVNPAIVDRVITVEVSDGSTSSNTAISTIQVVAIPEIAISDSSSGEGASVVFNVTLSSPAIDDIVLDFSTTGVTASDGSDYENVNFGYSLDGGTTWLPASGASGTEITVPTGASSVLVRVDTLDDGTVEINETFTLGASVISGTTNSVGSGTGTIVDNDQPSFSIDDILRDEDAGTMTFTVSLDQSPVAPTSINWATAAGTATENVDYIGASGTLLFGIGQSTRTISISLSDDNTYEGSEQFFVNLSGAVGATISDGQGIGTMVDDGSTGTDDDRPSFSVGDITVTEGTDPFAVFTIELSNASVEDIEFGLSLTDGSATGGGIDFGAGLEYFDGLSWQVVSGPVTISNGNLTVQVRTPIVDDPVSDDGEQFTLTATRTSGTTLNALDVGTATIQDEMPGDSALVSMIGPASVAEGDTTTPYTVSIDLTPTTDVTVNLSYSGTATDGTDFTGVASVTIAANTNSATFTLPTLDDALAEGAEDIIIDIASVNGGGFEAIAEHSINNQVTTTINDEVVAGPEDTALVSITGPASVTEGDFTTPYTVSIDLTPTSDVTVNLSYSGTATDGSDFTGVASVVIAANTNSATFTLPTLDDALAEGAEDIVIDIASVTGGGFEAIAEHSVNNQVTTTINDEAVAGPEDTALVSITGPASVTEGDFTTPYTVSIDLTPTSDVTVNLSYSGTATDGSDFTGVASVVIAANTNSATFTLPTLDDALAEGVEDIIIDIASVTGGGFEAIVEHSVNNQVTATINDEAVAGPEDTALVSITGPASVTEGDFTTPYTVSIDLTPTSDVTVNLSYSGTATVGSDFTGVASVVIAANTNSATFTLPTLDDALAEGAEDIIIDIASVTGGSFEAIAEHSVNNQVTTTINDEAVAGPEDTALVSITGPASVTEGDNTTPYTVSIDLTPTTDVTVNLSYSGTATDGSDFTGVASVTIAANTNSATFTLPTLDDALAEGAEDIIIDIASVNGGGFEAIAEHSVNNQVTTTINDETVAGPEDTALVSVTGPASVTEGDTTTPYTISIDLTPTSDVTINLGYSGTALDGSDFTGVASVVIAANTNSATFTLPTLDDALAEGAEDIIIDIASVNGGGFEAIAEHSVNNEVTTTINDEAVAGPEDTALVSITGPASVIEGDSTTPYTVSIDLTPTSDVTVNLTYSGTATDGTDFTGVASVTIRANTMSQTFNVQTLDDALAEGTEEIIIDITSIGGGGFEEIAPHGTNHRVATAIDDEVVSGPEDTARVSIAGPASVNEGSRTAPYSVSIDRVPQSNVTVNLMYSGTAVDGQDFVGIASVTIRANTTSTSFTLPTLNDRLAEGTEDIIVDISSVSGGGFEAIASHPTDNQVITSILESDLPFGYDSFNNLSKPKPEPHFDQPRDILLSESISELAAQPILAGYAQPGTILMARLYGSDGSIIAESTTTVDAAGNWTLQFRNVNATVETRVVIEHVASEAVALGNAQFRLTPDTYRSMQLSTYHERAMTAGSILGDAPMASLMGQHAENLNPLLLLEP